MFELSSEAMNRMWDREDQNLAFAWQSAESELDRKIDVYQADRGFDLKERELSNEEDSSFGRALFEGGKYLLDKLDIF